MDCVFRGFLVAESLATVPIWVKYMRISYGTYTTVPSVLREVETVFWGQPSPENDTFPMVIW